MKDLKQKLYNLLRWSEKYTKTDMVYLSKGGGWITAGNIVSSIGSFLLIIAFGNLISPHDYGVYKYILSVVAILSIPTLSGINTAVTQAVAKGFDGSYTEGFKTKIKWGLWGGVASIFLAGYYFINDNNTLAFAFLISTIFLPFMDTFKLYGSFLNGKKYFKQSSLYNSVAIIVRVTALIFTLFLTQNIFLILIVDFMSSTTMRFILFLYVAHKYPMNNKTDSSTISYGKHLSLMTVLGTISSQLDKMLLFTFIGSVELAVYSFAVAPITKMSGLLAPVTALAFPKFAENKPEVLKKTLPKKLFYFFIISAGITITYITLAPTIYKFIFPAYTEAVLFSQVFALSLLFFPQKLLAVSLTAHKQQKALYVINTLSPLVKISALLILLPFFGIWGAVIAFLIPLVLNGILSIYYFQKM